MPLEFDHLFIFTTVEAPELDHLLALGLTEGTRNVHPGQGTANRRVFFHNAFLEFLWVHDPAETQREGIRPVGFWERHRYRQTGASPFGLLFRPARAGEPASLPFATWAYRPPYLPPGLQIDLGQNSARLTEPLLGYIPFGGRPDTYPDERKQPLAHATGFQAITGLRLSLPLTEPLSPPLAAVERAGWVQFEPDQAHLAEVTFDQASQGQVADFRPALPLIFRW